MGVIGKTAAHVLDFFGVGPKREKRQCRMQAIQAGAADVVKLSRQVEKSAKTLDNPARDLATAMRRARVRKKPSKAT